MKKNVLILASYLLIILKVNIFAAFNAIDPGQDILLQFLENIPGATIEKLEADSTFSIRYKIMLEQPLDHNNPDNGIFNQRIYLSHLLFEKPMVIVTEGYSARHNYCEELCNILGANQLFVEHRYFGESQPDSLDWDYLNLEQAMEDYHRIASIFKKLYKEEWISTGWSKGGQTTMMYKMTYPEDFEVGVVYDSPLNFALEDKRVDEHFDNVGTADQRKKLIDFQRLVLNHKREILPLFEWYAKGAGLKYSIGFEKGLEFCVLEYPFSFWQYTDHIFEKIPQKGSTPGEILEHLRSVVSFGSYADRSMNSASMYQFSTEFGYYGYVQKNVKDLLNDTEYRNWSYAPEGAYLKYSNKLMLDLNEWLQDNGNKMLYIYSEADPWSAPHVVINGSADYMKKFLRGGNHFTFIRTFPRNERKEILDKLSEWLNIKIDDKWYNL
ncbi:MAG: peptidase [Bacteroidetes bacterium]|nr:peptidase [Bacteroidota bacterium]